MRKLLGVVVVACLAAAWACSTDYETSPDGVLDAGLDATPIADQSAPEAATGTSDGGGAGGAVLDAGADAADAADSAPLDASVCASRCDCDGDGYLAIGCDAGASASGSPGDCDDNDKATHPGADFQERVPVSPQNGDWNCDGVVELAIPSNLSTCPTQGLSCLAAMGFVAEVECGAIGTYATCQAAVAPLGGCAKPVISGTERQRCK